MSKSNNHLIDIVQNYVRRERYNINEKDFSLQLRSNQSFPSVKSITDTFDYFGINNIAARVPQEALSELPEFFLAVVKHGRDAIVAVTQTRKGLKILKADGSTEKLSRASFVEQWDGTVIAIENEQAEKKTWNMGKSMPALLCTLLVATALSKAVLFGNLPFVIMCLLCCIGAVVSFFLVQENLGIHNEVTSKLCNSENAATSCSDVVKSNSGNLLKGLSLSDLSVTFFASTLLTLALTGYDQTFFFLLSAGGVPFIIYSIYVQAISLKKWCPLCLVVAGVLLGMLATTIPGLALPVSLPAMSYLVSAVPLFALVIIGWNQLKKIIEEGLNAEKVSVDFMRFKRTERLFTDMLQKYRIQTFAPLDEDAQMTFGNPQAKIEIYTVTNPLCGHCNATFKVFDQLLASHGKDFRLNIVFSVPVTNKENDSTQIARRILEFYRTDPQKAFQSMKDWYADKDVEEWQQRYGLPEKEESFAMMEKSKEWCRIAEVPGTPTTLINGCHYPSEYEIEDLLYLMGDLAEMARVAQPKTEKVTSLA